MNQSLVVVTLATEQVGGSTKAEGSIMMFTKAKFKTPLSKSEYKKEIRVLFSHL